MVTLYEISGLQNIYQRILYENKVYFYIICFIISTKAVGKLQGASSTSDQASKLICFYQLHELI